jgi:lysophospholipase L1-like esterase
MSRTRLLAVTTALCAGLVISPASASAADVRDGSPVERVVTLGDSYSSGSGIHRNATDYDDHGPEGHSFRPRTRLGASACQRELDETPGPRLAAELGAESIVVACAGAVIREMPAQVRAADIPGDGGGTVVSVTIGGNDVRTERGESWPDALLRCITSIGCDRSSNELANLDDLRRELTDVYADIGERYPEISVRVLGYPRLMQSDRFCEGVAGMSRSEADFVDEQVDRLNAKISSAVALASARTGADLRFVSVVDEFDNHGACRFWQRDRYVNDAVFGDSLRRSRLADGTVRDHVDDSPLNISSASFHPSSEGYDAYGRALTASIADLLDPDLR